MPYCCNDFFAAIPVITLWERNPMLSNIILVTLMALNGSGPEVIPLYMNDLDDYGYVWDLNLQYYEDPNCDVNDMSCVPTSWINNLVYLQNKHASELDGLELVGNDYAAWSENVVNLRSPANMNTTGPSGPGTTPAGQVRGIINYLDETGVGPLANRMQAIASPLGLAQDPSVSPGDFPYWVIRGAVDMQQLDYWLRSGAAVTVLVLYTDNANPNAPDPNGAGHALAVVGLEYTDKNQNGFMDLGEAQLYVIDPLDPTLGSYTPDGHQPIGPAAATTVQVWQEQTPTDPSTYGMLNIRYNQSNSAACQPYNPGTHIADGWLSGAAALSIISGPGGSCCLATGCSSLTEVGCTELGGTWTLSGSCDDCAPACDGDNDNDGTVGIEDLLIVIEHWGFCP